MAISRPQINRQLRKDGGILTIDDARRMAPPGEDLAYINKDEAALLKSLGGAGEDINGTGIKSYFLKKVFRKAKKAVKKVVKSPIGKAAILGGLTFGVPGTGFKGFLGAGKGGGLGSFIKRKLIGTPLAGDITSTGGPGILQKLGLIKGDPGSFGGLTGLGKIAGITGLSGLAGLMAAGEQDEEDEVDLSKLDRGEGLNILDIVARARKNDPEFRFLPGAEFTDTYAEGGEVDKKNKMIKDMLDRGADDDLIKSITGASQEEINILKKLKQTDPDKQLRKEGKLPKLQMMAEGGPINLGMDLYLITKQALEKEGYSPGEAHEKALDASGMRDYFDKISEKKKYGGRIGKQEGGIMDLGGMEMDLRGGGFVPLGAKEKADDVPARLSKNEFVMTADAVRAAGGGSVDKGADKMYNLMKDLESRV